MAKTIMKCPFSDKVCAECAIYRGRHYFLCFASKYRGRIDESANKRMPHAFRIEPRPQFEIPLIIPDKSLDPFNNDKAE